MCIESENNFDRYFKEYEEEYNKLREDSRVSDVSSAFDYTKSVYDKDNIFKESNYQDPILTPLRNLIEEVRISGDFINGLSTDMRGNVIVSHNWNNDNNYTIISDELNGDVYYVKYYKNRGRTENLKYLDTGQDLTAYDLLEVYDNLGILEY